MAETKVSPPCGQVRQPGSSRNQHVDHRLGATPLQQGTLSDVRFSIHADEQLRIAVDWGRYGELFDLDAKTGQLTLDQAQNAGAA